MSTNNTSFFSKDTIPAVCTNEWCIMFTILVVLLALMYSCVQIEIENNCIHKNNQSITNIKDHLYYIIMFTIVFFVFCSIFFIHPRNFNIGNLAFCFAYTIIFFIFSSYYHSVLNPYESSDDIENPITNNKTSQTTLLYVLGPLIASLICVFAGYGNTFIKSSIIMIIFSIFVLLFSPIYKHFYNKSHTHISNTYNKSSKQ